LDLFTYQTEQSPQNRLLADRMRPVTLDEYIGQDHIVGKEKLLRRAIEADQVSSILLYGPPGTGKTTLAHIISKKTNGEFVRLNAVDASVKDVREVIDRAKESKAMYGTKTTLFLDEVHRFNTARQDALLPAVEQGIIVFIGATTENPFHHVNGALLSRSTLFELKSLTHEHSLIAMRRALADRERGLASSRCASTKKPWIISPAWRTAISAARSTRSSLRRSRPFRMPTAPSTSHWRWRRNPSGGPR
jgi:putative ATPase